MRRKYYRCLECHIVFPVAASIAAEYRTCPNCMGQDTVRSTAKIYKRWREAR